MKTCILIFMLFISNTSLFSQELYFDVRGKYEHKIQKEKLVSAQLLREIIFGYPTSWINNYESVDVIVTTKGVTKKASGKSEELTADQRALLNSAELFTLLEIKVNYTTINAITEKLELRVMDFSMTVVPEKEAEFKGGTIPMRTYLKSNAVSKISNFIAEYIVDGVVTFIVDKKGAIIGATLTKSTGDSITDALLLNTIKNMPQWHPAVDSNGINVNQEFEFIVSKGGC